MRKSSMITFSRDTPVVHWCYTLLPAMPTSKKRLNLTLPKDLAVFLKKISLRDDMPQAAKALELIERGLEMEEGVFKKEFVKEIKRREKDHRLIPAEEVFKRLW